MKGEKGAKAPASKAGSEPVSFRLRADLMDRLREEARANYRSITAQLTLILDRFFAEKGGK